MPRQSRLEYDRGGIMGQPCQIRVAFLESARLCELTHNVRYRRDSNEKKKRMNLSLSSVQDSSPDPFFTRPKASHPKNK